MTNYSHKDYKKMVPGRARFAWENGEDKPAKSKRVDPAPYAQPEDAHGGVKEALTDGRPWV